MDSDEHGHRPGFSIFLNQILPTWNTGQTTSPNIFWATLWIFTLFLYALLSPLSYHWLSAFYVSDLLQTPFYKGLLYTLSQYQWALLISCTSSYQYMEGIFTLGHYIHKKRIWTYILDLIYVAQQHIYLQMVHSMALMLTSIHSLPGCRGNP